MPGPRSPPTMAKAGNGKSFERFWRKIWKMAGLWWKMLGIPEIYTEDLKKS